MILEFLGKTGPMRRRMKKNEKNAEGGTVMRLVLEQKYNLH